MHGVSRSTSSELYRIPSIHRVPLPLLDINGQIRQTPVKPTPRKRRYYSTGNRRNACPSFLIFTAIPVRSAPSDRCTSGRLSGCRGCPGRKNPGRVPFRHIQNRPIHEPVSYRTPAIVDLVVVDELPLTRRDKFSCENPMQIGRQCCKATAGDPDRDRLNHIEPH